MNDIWQITKSHILFLIWPFFISSLICKLIRILSLISLLLFFMLFLFLLLLLQTAIPLVFIYVARSCQFEKQGSLELFTTQEDWLFWVKAFNCTHHRRWGALKVISGPVHSSAALNNKSVSCVWEGMLRQVWFQEGGFALVVVKLYGKPTNK